MGKKTLEESQITGYSAKSELIVDGIVEINPSTNEIVWDWHAWDHLV